MTIKTRKKSEIIATIPENLEELLIVNAIQDSNNSVIIIVNSVIIHNASYDTHFILNQLAIAFKGELNCIGDNMEKYVTFSVPIKKECDNNKTITYR